MKSRTLLAAIVAGCAMLCAACSPSLIKTDGQRISAACATASASIKVITAANELGKLDDKQRLIVSETIGIITPICSADEPPTMDDVKREAFMQAIGQLQRRASWLQAEGVAP
jgi:hypothetical protein